MNRCLRSHHIAIWSAPNIYLRSRQPPPNILEWEVPHTRAGHHLLDGTDVRIDDPPRGYAIVAQLASVSSAHAQAQAWLRYDRKVHYGEVGKFQHGKVVGYTHVPPAAHIEGSAGTVAWTALDTEWPQTKVVAACVTSAAG